MLKNTVERRLLNDKDRPNFGLNLFILNAKGEFAGVSMYASKFAVCTENGPQTLDTEPLFQGGPTDWHSAVGSPLTTTQAITR